MGEDRVGHHGRCSASRDDDGCVSARDARVHRKSERDERETDDGAHTLNAIDCAYHDRAQERVDRSNPRNPCSGPRLDLELELVPATEGRASAVYCLGLGGRVWNAAHKSSGARPVGSRGARQADARTVAVRSLHSAQVVIDESVQ